MRLTNIAFTPDCIQFVLTAKNGAALPVSLLVRENMQGSDLAFSLQACAKSILLKEWPWTKNGPETVPDGMPLELVAEEAAEIIRGGC